MKRGNSLRNFIRGLFIFLSLFLLNTSVKISNAEADSILDSEVLSEFNNNKSVYYSGDILEIDARVKEQYKNINNLKIQLLVETNEGQTIQTYNMNKVSTDKFKYTSKISDKNLKGNYRVIGLMYNYNKVDYKESKKKYLSNIRFMVNNKQEDIYVENIRTYKESNYTENSFVSVFINLYNPNNKVIKNIEADFISPITGTTERFQLTNLKGNEFYGRLPLSDNREVGIWSFDKTLITTNDKKYIIGHNMVYSGSSSGDHYRSDFEIIPKINGSYHPTIKSFSFSNKDIWEQEAVEVKMSAFNVRGNLPNYAKIKLISPITKQVIEYKMTPDYDNNIFSKVLYFDKYDEHGEWKIKEVIVDSFEKEPLVIDEKHELYKDFILDNSFIFHQGKNPKPIIEPTTELPTTERPTTEHPIAKPPVKQIVVRSPIINEKSVTDKSTSVSGISNSNGTVFVLANNKVIGKANAVNGKFKVKFNPVKAGSTLTVYTELNKVKSKTIAIKVKKAPAQKVAVATPVINQKYISNKTTSISGASKSNGTVYVLAKNKVIGKANISKGKFLVKFKALSAGTNVSVYTVRNKVKSKYVNFKVVDKIAPKPPVVNKVTTRSIKVTGSGEKNAQVTVYKGKTLIAKSAVNNKGKFALKINKQKKNTVLNVYLTDKSKNKSKPKSIKVS